MRGANGLEKLLFVSQNLSILPFPHQCAEFSGFVEAVRFKEHTGLVPCRDLNSRDGDRAAGVHTKKSPNWQRQTWCVHSDTVLTEGKEAEEVAFFSSQVLQDFRQCQLHFTEWEGLAHL